MINTYFAFCPQFKAAMVSIEHQIKSLHQCFLDKFKEIKEENENIEARLFKIEEILCNENQEKASRTKSNKKLNVVKEASTKPLNKGKQLTTKPKQSQPKKKKLQGWGDYLLTVLYTCSVQYWCTDPVLT